jgi:hypothetical protein
MTMREWSPSNWTLSEPIEILINRKSNYSEIIEYVSVIYPHIKVSSIFLNFLGRRPTNIQINSVDKCLYG